MSRKFFAGMVAVLFCLSLFAPYVLADQDYACKVMLCLMNPGGAKQFQECHPPINRLMRELAKGGKIPHCESAEADGYSMDTGYQPFLSCEQSYGSDYKPYTSPRDWQDDESNCWGTNPASFNKNYPDGYNYSDCSVCRKSLGLRDVYECSDPDDDASCGWVKKEVFDTKPLQRNRNGRFAEVKKDGQRQNDRHYW